LYFVPNRSGAPAAAPLAEGAGSEPVGADAGGAADPAGVEADGLADGPHAANTIIVPASKLAKRFFMNAPPLSVSPHTSDRRSPRS
jgi:hypothetical protein